MSDKTNTILTIILVFVITIVYTIFVAVPEYKKNLGSSDRLFFSSKYKNIVEIKIDDKVDFSLLFDNKARIYHIFFLDNNSTCLYNKNIENKDINNALKIIIPKLIENDLLKSTSVISVSYCEDYLIDSFKNELNAVLSNYNLQLLIDMKKISLVDIAKEKNIAGDSQDELLYNLDFVSHEFISDRESISNKEELNAITAKKLTDNVYKRIESYLFKKQIEDVSRDNNILNISLIPADNNSNYYPSSNSWFEKKDGKIYAYIELVEDNKIYSYCYLGSIDSYKEGLC